MFALTRPCASSRVLFDEGESKGSAVIFKADSDLCESGSVLSLSLPLHTKELSSLWPGEV